MLKLNETPKRTSKNFNINNIKLENISIPNNINSFTNFSYNLESTKDTIEFENINLNNNSLKYGIGKDIDNITSNKDIRLTCGEQAKYRPCFRLQIP